MGKKTGVLWRGGAAGVFGKGHVVGASVIKEIHPSFVVVDCAVRKRYDPVFTWTAFLLLS